MRSASATSQSLYLSSHINLAATINRSKTERLEILANRLMTESGKTPASCGRRIPFPILQSTGGNAVGFAGITIQFKEFGVLLTSRRR